MSAVGFLPYILFIFLPGLGLGEILGVWHPDDGFLARMGYCFGLGLCVDTAVVLVRTSGLTSVLSGLDPATLYGTISAGALLLVISIALRREVKWWVRPVRPDLVVLGVMALQGAILLLNFQKYPIFPEFQGTDFAAHIQIAQALISGTGTSIVHGILYYGIHF